MRFLIIGAGALGGYYGGALVKGGATSPFWCGRGGLCSSRSEV
jgi:ketopantoate reductase